MLRPVWGRVRLPHKKRCEDCLSNSCSGSESAVDAITYLLLAGIALTGSIFLGLLFRKPQPPAPPPPKEEPSRWAVFRIHLDRILEGGGPIVEALPKGISLSLRKPPRPRRPTLRLSDGSGKVRALIAARRRFGRTIVRIALDGRPLADLRGGRRDVILERVEPKGIEFQVSGDIGSLEMEARGGGKLLASLSPEISPAPGSVGVEVLAATDPLPVLSLFAGIALLFVLAVRPEEVPEGPAETPEEPRPPSDA
jgi:hypothetical protein